MAQMAQLGSTELSAAHRVPLNLGPERAYFVKCMKKKSHMFFCAPSSVENLGPTFSQFVQCEAGVNKIHAY